MTRQRVLLLGVGFALVVTVAAIALAGYYHNLALLVSSQVTVIFVPTLVPFLLLAAQRLTSKAMIVLVAAPMVLGWAAVIYIESQPYRGGGASFAVLLGWAACALSALLAVVAILVTPSSRSAARWRS